jgi:hypothetical protein
VAYALWGVSADYVIRLRSGYAGAIQVLTLLLSFCGGIFNVLIHPMLSMFQLSMHLMDKRESWIAPAPSWKCRFNGSDHIQRSKDRPPVGKRFWPQL